MLIYHTKLQVLTGSLFGATFSIALFYTLRYLQKSKKSPLIQLLTKFRVKNDYTQLALKYD